MATAWTALPPPRRGNVQWDVRGGRGLSEAADDYYFGVGLTVHIL